MAQVETGLTPEERISLTGDEWAQVRADKATVGDYLNLVAALSSDHNSDVLANAVDNVSMIADNVASNQGGARRARGMDSTDVSSLCMRISATPRQATRRTQRDLRAYLFGILAPGGKDANLLAQARDIANRYLADPSSVNPTLGQAALRIAAEDGDAALFDRLQKIYETSSDPELQEIALRELVTFTNPDLLERALEYSVSAKVRNQDSAIQFNIAMRIPENRDQTWKFIKSHWDQVQTEFTPEMGEYFVAGTGNFCSAEARDDVKNFFATHPVPAADAALRHAARAHRRLHRIAPPAGA